MKLNLLKFSLKTLTVLVFTLFFANCTSENTTNNNNIDSNSTQPADTITVQKTIDLSKYDRKYNDMALWLAGIPQDADGTYKDLENSDEWQNYSSDINAAFSQFKQERVTKLDSFRDAYLTDVNNSIKTLFYPYSGPDFINANIFFPKADKIIMAALEPVGYIPDFSTFSDYKKSSYFSQIIGSMRNILNQGYFVTKKMKVEYKSEVVDSISGVLPILYIFMAHSDCHILNVQKFTIDKEGNYALSLPNTTDLDDPNDTYISAVQIDYFRKGENEIKTVMYFSHNIGEPKIDDTPEFITFLEHQNVNVTYLKAASYLNIWFAKIRNFSLNNSDYIFQDDSGIPIEYFDENEWNIQLFGTYTKTLDMFRAYFQPLLRDMYKQSTNVIPLNFATGYNGTFEESNLQLISKK